ncbi:MoaD/ThiS family protein [Dehalococcoidales bacterium]|nr:MoaD/ThiS family protein [Dehalococcoidales bacterium]
MITVEVRLYATLRKYHPDPGSGESWFIALDDKAKLGNLLGELKLPKEEIQAVLVNGKWEEESYLLRDGDRVGIFPPIGGG